MRTTFLWLFNFSFILSIAQKPPSKFGEVDLNDMKLSKCEFDTTASAMVIFDKGVCSLDDQLRVIFKRHKRIKFFSHSNIAEWASETISLDRNEDHFSKLKAVTYNLENGNIVQSAIDETAIFKTKFDKYTNQVKFTLPNVKEGSIIEYSYTIETSASLLPSWQFQHNIPTAWSEYETFIPHSFTFRKDIEGFLALSDHVSKKEGDYEDYILKNVPAFKVEPYTKNPDDYISKISFYLSEVWFPGQQPQKFNKSWGSIIKSLNDQSDFGLQIRTSGFLKDIVEKITTGISDDQKKIDAIYNYVKESVTWNKNIDAIPDRPFKKVLDEKKGSSSEINLLLVSMLQKAGLKSFPVLLSTRNHGIIRPFVPRFNQFNYVICLVKSGEKKILLDATDSFLPQKSLPKRCLNGEGLVVSIEEMEWIPLVSTRSKKVINVNCKMEQNGEITGELVVSTDGIYGSELRSTLTEIGQEKYVKEFTEGKAWEISNPKFENTENPSLPIKENYAVTIRDHAQIAGPSIYLNPYLYSQMTENIFKSETRLYPVDYSTPFEEIYMAKIQVPENYSIEEQPKPKIIAMPNNAGKFIHSVTQSGNTINFISQFIVNKSVFSAIEYPALKEFYSLVVAKEAEQIVLKKK